MSIATVYSSIWNEEVRLPYFIKHYRERLPGCQIVFFDNQSTDNTLRIAFDNDCTVVSFNTNNQICDETLRNNKNNCWKQWHINRSPWECWHHWSWTSKNEKLYLESYPDVKVAIENGSVNCGMTHFFNYGIREGRVVPERPTSSVWGCNTDWCIVVDCDELLDVNEELLANANFNIINSDVYDMWADTNNIDDMTHGVIFGAKVLCWKAKEFYDINYGAGAHACNPNPVANTAFNTFKIPTYHVKWISYEYVINRYRVFNTRDHENYKKGMGVQSHFPESVQLRYFTDLKQYGTKVRYV